MPCNDAAFKSYSWSYGTTSFRVSELKYKIEKQLILLKTLWEKFPDKTWRELQGIYFEMLVTNHLAKPTAMNKEKDARQKTSPLKDLGLITEKRELTEVGEKIYSIAKNNDYNFNNILQIRNDSFIYLKQFLKIEFSTNSNSRAYSEFKINPFLAIIYAITELGYLTKDEITYLLPICKNFNEVKKLVEKINHLSVSDRDNEFPFTEKYIDKKILSLSNYQKALDCLLEEPLNFDHFAKAMMNRKSKKYTKPLFELFKKIVEYFQAKKSSPDKEKIKKIQKILNCTNHTRIRTYLKNFFFQGNIKIIKKDYIAKFEEKINFPQVEDLYRFLFLLFHRYGWIENLKDYYDLNRRFISLTDIFIFEHERIYLDEIAFAFFSSIRNKLLSEDIFSSSPRDYVDKLYTDLHIEKISSIFSVSEKQIFNFLVKKYPKIRREKDLRKAITIIKKMNQKQRFIDLIKNYFGNKSLIKLLRKIRDREDKYVLDYMDWECDVSTIFEYTVGIILYKLVDYEGDLTDFFNLHLDANLLPRRFASGNKADSIFKLKSGHILLEVTLTNKDNQRKLELEPVSRHLGKYILQSGQNAYAVFVAPFLDPNVLVAFRAYKSLKYYDSSNTKKYIKGLKIIPLDIDDLILILKKGITYSRLSKIFNNSYENEEIDGYIWYTNILEGGLTCA